MPRPGRAPQDPVLRRTVDFDEGEAPPRGFATTVTMGLGYRVMRSRVQGSEQSMGTMALEVSVRGVVRDPSRVGPRRPDGIPVVPIEHLEEELRGADILVVTIPATDATRGLLDRARLDLLPEGSVLVNVGRAAVIGLVACRWYGRATGLLS